MSIEPGLDCMQVKILHLFELGMLKDHHFSAKKSHLIIKE